MIGTSNANNGVKELYKDLSMYDIYGNSIKQSTANCYVISKAGGYKFPLVYGNALKNGRVNADAYTKIGTTTAFQFCNHLDAPITSPYIENHANCTAASAELSMSDEPGIISGLEVISGESCRYIKFNVDVVPAVGANAVISVKNSSGVVMWSWHIWLWADDLSTKTLTNATGYKYKILPVNLASKWDSPEKYRIKNWYYQWGRHVPMLCPAAYNSTTDHPNYGVKTFTKSTAQAASYGASLQHPETFYVYGTSANYNWFGDSSYYNLWDAQCATTGNYDNNVIKTVYDPNPIGFKMPNGNTFTYFSTSTVIGSFDAGYTFKCDASDTEGVFFPASGCRWRDLLDVGGGGYVYLPTINASDANYRNGYQIYNKMSNHSYKNYPYNAFAVRSVADVDIVEDPHDLSMHDIWGNRIAQTTANCYIVRNAGVYKFPLVYGNAIENGADNPVAYKLSAAPSAVQSASTSFSFVNHLNAAITSPYIENNSGCTAASAEISMSDSMGAVSNVEIINGSPCRYLQFNVNQVPAEAGNVVLSVKDTSGRVMWSWHIWLYPPTFNLSVATLTNATGYNYNILRDNLATKYDLSTLTASTEMGKRRKNWYYQWGRHVPMLCPSAYNSTTDHYNCGVKTFTKSTAQAANYGEALQHPETFYVYGTNANYNWFGSSSYYNLWDANCYQTGNYDNDVVKTIYDPNPVGFKMPNGNTFTYFSTSTVIGSFDAGYTFKCNSSDTTGVFFPASGARQPDIYNEANYMQVRVYTANHTFGNAYILFAYYGYVYNQAYAEGKKYLGQSVRSVQEY